MIDEFPHGLVTNFLRVNNSSANTLLNVGHWKKKGETRFIPTTHSAPSHAVLPRLHHIGPHAATRESHLSRGWLLAACFIGAVILKIGRPRQQLRPLQYITARRRAVRLLPRTVFFDCNSNASSSTSPPATFIILAFRLYELGTTLTTNKIGKASEASDTVIFKFYDTLPSLRR